VLAIMPKKEDPAIAWLSSLIAPLSPKEFMLGQAGRLLAESGQLRPPFDPKRAIPPSVRRIEITRLSRDGMLVPVEGGFIIKLNSEKPLVRQNFACAHEIGHTFFYDISGTRPWRPPASMSSYWAEENLCYQFAEEMLMPGCQIKRIADTLDPSINNFQRLIKMFQVSAEALARRILRLNLWDCILIILISNVERKLPTLKPKVIYKHKNYKYYSIAWEKLLSQESDPYAALKEPGVLKKSIRSSSHLFRRGTKYGYWSLESFCFGGTTSGLVVSLMVPTVYEPFQDEE
jgi:Zn-dependent peptidase ImmA (M78 family)